MLCRITILSSAVVAAALFLCGSALAQIPTTSGDQPLDEVTFKVDLYPANFDAHKQIEGAILRATDEKKRVLLIFGANWCYDCHVLDKALHQGELGKIVSENFLLVHVDIGEGEKNPDLVKQYKIPLDKGVPAVAVLESDGHLLYSSGNGEFEAARRMLKKDLIQFLRHWQKQDPPR
jgi:thioredoxin 1